MTTAMTKGNKLVTELSAKMDYLDKAIERLEGEKQALQDKLDTGSNQFDMDVVKKNKAIQQEINLTQQTIEDAKSEREKVIEGNAADTFNKAMQIMREYRNEKKAEHKADNLAIVEHIEAIREKVKLIEEKDSEYTKELDSFIKAVRPFLDKEPTKYGGMQELKYGKLEDKAHSWGRFNVLELPSERHLGLDDLFEQPSVTIVDWTAKEKARFS